MMSGHIKMKEMTWTEYAGRKDGIVILPIGATEQHGPHLPLCVDTVLAEEFSYRIAGQVDGIVAPALCYGYKSKPFSGGGPLFPGTIDLNGQTLQADGEKGWYLMTVDGYSIGWGKLAGGMIKNHYPKGLRIPL